MQISDVAVPMKLNRNAELEADLLGLQYMYLAGYDPSEFLRFLDRGYAAEDRRLSRMAQVFSGFPCLDKRLRQDRAMVSTFPPREKYVLRCSTLGLSLQGVYRSEGQRERSFAHPAPSNRMSWQQPIAPAVVSEPEPLDPADYFVVYPESHLAHGSRASLRALQCGSAKVKMSLCAAIATYWTPSTAKVIGEATNFWPVLKCHNGRPVAASTASKDSASSPKNTSPPAVVSVPPQELPWPICG